MLAIGAPPEAIDAAVANEEIEHPPFEVYPENERIVDVFRALSTQWNVVAGGLGGARFLGLNYASAMAIMPAHGVRNKDRAEVLAGLRIMESAALEVMNRPAEQSEP